MQKIMETTNYKMFELHEVNRDVKKIARIRDAMMKFGWISAYPINVTQNGSGKLLIKDGHHRFEAATELGLPIKYVVCHDDATIYDINFPTTPWSFRDYMVSYARSGRVDYRIVHEYCRKTGIAPNQAASMFFGHTAGSHNVDTIFKRGEFKIKDAEHPKTVGEIVSHMKKHGIKWASGSLMVHTISRMVWVKEFSPAIFKQKIKSFSHLVEKQPNLAGYESMIDRVYNYKSQSKIPLAFLASEAAKARNAVQK
ncbi:MAG: hypothetical protein WC262_12105 [Bacteroidales bacterium]